MKALLDRISRCVTERSGRYDYLVSPLEGAPEPLWPALLDEAASTLAGAIETASCDGLVCFEAMGIQIGTLVAQRTGKPLYIARKKRFSSLRGLSFKVRSRGEERQFFLYGTFTGQRIVLVDDVISTGATMAAACRALRSQGADVRLAVVVVARGSRYQARLRALELNLAALGRVRVAGRRVHLVPDGGTGAPSDRPS